MGGKGKGEIRFMTEKTELDWWDRPDEPEQPKPTVEELMTRMERMRQAQEGIPKGLLFKQFFALVYIVINVIFMYSNMNSSFMGYVAAYMVPLILLLIDYFLVIASLKKIARGEPK